MSKSMAQQLLEEGRALGIKEGEARGEARRAVRGRQRIMVNLLHAKFGDLPSGVEEQLQRMSIEELDQLAVDLIYAQSLEELKLGNEE